MYRHEQSTEFLGDKTAVALWIHTNASAVFQFPPLWGTQVQESGLPTSLCLHRRGPDGWPARSWWLPRTPDTRSVVAVSSAVVVRLQSPCNTSAPQPGDQEVRRPLAGRGKRCLSRIDEATELRTLWPLQHPYTCALIVWCKSWHLNVSTYCELYVLALEVRTYCMVVCPGTECTHLLYVVRPGT